VFRSGTGVAYDSTSILATLLRWFGVPKSGWGLGERTNHAPTFEAVLRRKTPRAARSLPDPRPAYPPQDRGHEPVHGLQQAMAFRVLSSELSHLPPAEIQGIARSVLERAKDTASLHDLIRAAITRHT
jgi:hypothetical protein